ncbi:MAG: tetratricopeptide repeat protein [Calditrichaeota bacterium]|nr:tetratricopeptide repeat protein [Calditrichota bacterium]
MMRLAELYYEQTQSKYQRSMQEYDRLYSLYDRGELLQAPEEPQKDLSNSLNLYASVIEDYPQSDLVDDAFYNIGFLLEENSHPDSAKAYYEKIEHDFPDSPLMPDVYMRIGEYYFNPPVNKIEKAISYYKKALAFHDSPRYDEALYRLGWSYYRLNDYSKAISYFTELADDVERTKPLDPEQKYSNPSLVDESVEYIGLSFLEEGGAEKANDYLKEIGGRDYGVNVLRRIGDAYMNEKEDYENAIKTYTLLLKDYPDDPSAPVVQNRIVQSYRRLEDPLMAYLSRDILFTKYKDGSTWWKKNDDKQARKIAHELAESAGRDNITTLLTRAQEGDQTDLYEQAVVESERYLKAFPSDSSAPLIHWNMALTLDMKLKKSDQAYNEYMKISQIYWDSKYQRFAAENAVALARDAAISAIAAAEKKASEEQALSIEALKQQAGEKKGGAFSFREKLRLQSTELSPKEIRLAQAYDNYIKLFPHARETPIFLANAGAVYYRHHQFRESLKYFKTLLRYFPGSEQVNQARYAIMESYFGRGDFNSSEIIARRIIYGDASDEIKSKARRRLAESIFLSAEILAEEKKHMAAGNEYRRMVKETPRSQFADLALLNAALEYDKANEFSRAIETYNFLLASHPNSEYLLDAQNNLAFDYVELNDFVNAALTYERLAAIHPDNEKARDALYNSSLYFSKAKDWKNAAKINELFIQRFPNDEAADDLSYEIAGFYRRLNEYEQAQTAYEKFVDQYPTSPRVIEALYFRGEYYKQMGKIKNAIIEFQRALAKSRDFEKQGLDRNDYYAAEAEFSLAMAKMNEFEEIQFRLPEAELAHSKEQKKTLLLEIIRHLGNCASYGTMRLYEATYRIGETYQEFADTWAGQDIPEIEETRRIVAQKEVADAAIELYRRSGDAYRNAITALGNLENKYKEKLFEEAAADTTTAAPIDSAKIVAQDSTLRVADKWIDRSKSKLSQVNYEIGSISLKSAKAVMNAPIPRGLSKFPRFVYRRKVIDIAVAPLLTQTLQGYQRNLVDADSFHIDSQWIDLSKQKLIATKNFVPASYSALAVDALGLLKEEYVDYSKLVYSKRDFNELLNDLQISSDEMANLVDFIKSLRVDATNKYYETIEMASKLKIEDSYIAASKDSMVSSILNFALKCDTLASDAKTRADRTRELFLKTQDPVYEEGLYTFESSYFMLRDVQQQIMEEGYNICKALKIDNLYSKNLALQLVRFNPEKYAGILDLKIVTTQFSTDTTWLASPRYYEGWVAPGFDQSVWKNALLVRQQEKGFASAIWFYEIKQDTSAVEPGVPDTTRKPVEYIPVQKAYFRGVFSVKGLPVTCKIHVFADEQYSLYFNGDLIKRLTDSDSTQAQGTFDVSELLQKDKNVIAIQVVDSDGTAGGLRARLTVKSLPGWDEKLEMLRPELATQKTKEDLMLEKGRIP